jgi:galactokinase
LKPIERFTAAEIERARILARDMPAGGRIYAVRAPGRVNLIGEHTDYSGLPVLPIAIDRSTIAVASPRDDRIVQIRNADPAWPPRRFEIAAHIAPYPTGDWGNYIKAAVQGVIDHFGERGQGVESMRGATLAIDGRVPAASGLSSSAALTVSTTIAFMAVNTLKLAPLEIASLAARSEWYVGTRSGGMDQAASVMAEAGCAMFIEFDPLRVRMVAMPADAAIVVADSLEIADKSGRVRAEYNRRVVECAIAARIAARSLAIPGVRILGDVVHATPQLGCSAILAAIDRITPPELDSDLREAAVILGVDRDSLADEILGRGDDRIALDQSRPLRVFARARHGLSENERVVAAVEALEAGDLDRMGELMDASHESLARDYECSTAALDSIVEAARAGGALGARLTGAGFGGSIVAMCRARDAQSVIESIDRRYYASAGVAAPTVTMRDVMRAGPGAALIELSSI